MVYLTWERCSNLVCVGKGDVEKGGMEFPWGVSRIVSIIPRDILTGSPLDRILKYFGNKIGRIAAQSVFNKCHVVRIDLYVYVLYHITLKLPKDFKHALYEYFWDIYTINISVMNSNHKFNFLYSLLSMPMIFIATYTFLFFYIIFKSLYSHY